MKSMISNQNKNEVFYVESARANTFMKIGIKIRQQIIEVGIRESFNLEFPWHTIS